MRRRMIDPSLWEDLEIGHLSMPAMLLFIGAFSNADDYGNIEAHPHYLKRKILGYHDEVSCEDISEWRQAIIALRSVTLYTVNGKEYLHFNNWEKYQKLDSRYTRKAACPPCPGRPSPESPEPLPEISELPTESPKLPDDGTTPRQALDKSEKSDVKAPHSLAIERDAALSKVNISKENLSEEKKKSLAASPPPSPPPELPNSEPQPKPPPLTEGQLFFLDAFGRRRFATNIQKQSVADIEAEVGLERWKNAVTWAARNNIRNLDSMITAARKAKKVKAKPSANDHGIADPNDPDIAEWLAKRLVLSPVEGKERSG